MPARSCSGGWAAGSALVAYEAPPVEVETTPRTWPGQLLEAHGVTVDSNDLVEVVRDGRDVSGARKRVREGDVVRLTGGGCSWAGSPTPSPAPTGSTGPPSPTASPAATPCGEPGRLPVRHRDLAQRGGLRTSHLRLGR